MSALDVQQGGSHYKNFAIQPIEYTMKNGLGFIEGNIVKYITRHKLKNKAEDIEKVIHYGQLLLELEYGVKSKIIQATEEDMPDSGTNLIQYLLRHQFKDLVFKSLVHQMINLDWEGTQELINQTIINHPLVSEDSALLDIKLREI